MTMGLIENMNVSLPVIIPPTPSVRLNKKNIHHVEKAIFETYKISHDKQNQYQILGDATCWGLLHDATSHYVKEVNSIFIRAVSPDGHVTKIPYCMHKVPGSLTGEVLCEELMEQISLTKGVHNNAFEVVPKKIMNQNVEYSPEVMWKMCQLNLQHAAKNMDFEKLQLEQKKAQDLLKKYDYLNDICSLEHIDHPNNYDFEPNSLTVDDTGSPEEAIILPKPPHFRLATLKSLDASKIKLEVEADGTPTCITGDG